MIKVWSKASNGGGAQCEISPAQFLNALLRVAMLRYDTSSATPTCCLRWLMDDHIVARASFADPDEFRAALGADMVRAAYQHQRAPLLKVFSHYAVTHGERKVDKETMSFAEFKKLCDDSHIAGPHCTHYALQQIFLKMQEEDNVDDVCADFGEFQEVLGAVAAFKNPAPYLPLHQKVRRFLEQALIAPLSDRLKLPPPGGCIGEHNFLSAPRQVQPLSGIKA